MSDWILDSDDRFRYMLLDRLRQDCDYYLGYGNRSVKALWAEDESAQIRAMKTLWLSFSSEDKPEWLTWEQILNYEKEMVKNG